MIRMNLTKYSIAGYTTTHLAVCDWSVLIHRLSCSPSRSWAKEMLHNVRLSCCIAGSTNTVPKEEDVQETLQILADIHGAPPTLQYGPPWVGSDHPLSYVEEGMRQGAACMVGGCEL